ncbi:hypothetical protein AcW1_001669 [Taiwanofungus camphoratus]|nr:hypothetical protein AcV7_001526 [Antrodia cinnamomea]KAI0945450.1 hypothetical protein AcW1_001669 [Antrodia cinnamomea]
MPRNHNAGPSTLRNRNRVTNKTRLKVITESIDADPIVLDEDEEKARVVSTAGVDAEDANEHHLQAVLSAAATRHQSTTRSTRAASEKEKVVPAAYIPTPDSTGVVDNYEELYPPGRWKDTTTYVKSSDTVEESISHALANGFLYYMDERDKEWLDKKNEEARGEGTSAQGALSGTSTRSARSAKAKGKEPDVTQPIAMSEDEFELVMAIFEKVTHEKTEFLHHGLEQGAPFPPFSDYQDAFETQLQPSMFALFTVPSWVPQPPHLAHLARVVYPYWRERRLERNGHRIIPGVNLDETDTRNESYICFRRREIKAIRKTRAQQATYSDKLLRLRAELDTSVDLARSIQQREVFKRNAAVHGHAVWEKRLALVDLKRKYHSLGSKEDDELFYDKERVPKRPKLEATGRIPLRLRTRDNGELASPVAHAEPTIRPKERLAQIQSQIEQEMARRREKDHGWEDAIDNPYQHAPVPYSSKLFKVIAANRASFSSPSSSDGDTPYPARQYRAGRLRFGRGGRLHLDRRILKPRIVSPSEPTTEAEPNDVEVRERARRITEQWKFDSDDDPVVGPEGPDEQDRTLVDDFDPKYLVHHMTLLSDLDHQSLTPDASIPVSTSDGRQQTIVPFRLSTQPMIRREPPSLQRPASSPHTTVQSISALHSNGSALSLPSSNGTPVAVATQLKMPPPGVAHMRISSNGGMRIPGPPTVSSMHTNINLQSNMSVPHNTSPNSAVQLNGFHDANGQSQDVGEPDSKQNIHSVPNCISQVGDDKPQSDSPSTSPVRPKAPIQQPVSMPTVPNGHHIASVNAHPTTMPNMSFMHPNTRPNGLTIQQMQNMKSAFASLSPSPDNSLQAHNMIHRIPPSTPWSHVFPNGYPLHIAAARQVQQWATAQQQRPPSVNTAEANGVEGIATPVLSPSVTGTPVRAPSANGTRTPLSRGMAVPTVSHSLGQGQGRASPVNAHIARLAAPHSPSPHLLSPSLVSTQPQSSPTRPQPSLASPSASMQSRQAVGSSGAGY